MKNINSCDKERRQKVYLSSISTNFLHMRNPWIVVWLSALFPGFGHLFLGRMLIGFILIFWEMIINIHAKINIAIIYSFTGRFEMAKDILDKRWLLLYASVFVFALWDCYRTTVELNKQTILADRENIRIKPYEISIFAINYLDKRNPLVAALWSGLMPGLGQIYNHSLLSGFFVFAWWIAITYFSHLAEAFHLSAIGNFAQVIKIINPQWLLFMPSIHLFAVYEAYVYAVESNKIFELEQINYLKDNYQDPEFEMPV